MISMQTRLPFLALLSSALLPILLPTSAAAVTITVGGITYDMSALSTSVTSQSTAFGLPPLGQMPWWENQTLASTFAMTVFNQLGPGWDGDYGPVFAYAIDTTKNEVQGMAQSISDSDDLIDVTPSTGSMVTYAIASPGTTSAVPGPLPVLVAGGGWVWSRRLKQRVRRAGSTVSPT